MCIYKQQCEHQLEII